jgi:DNA polymerase I
LLRVPRSDKRLRSFGHKLIEAISPVTGRVHPDFMLGTKTGRLACSAPNLQQLPADVRPAIVAPAGRLLVVADYAQIELRVLAELSGDDVLHAEFANGGDVHRAAAAAIAGSRSSRSPRSSARPPRPSCSAPSTAPVPAASAPLPGRTSTST